MQRISVFRFFVPVILAVFCLTFIVENAFAQRRVVRTRTTTSQPQQRLAAPTEPKETPTTTSPASRIRRGNTAETEKKETIPALSAQEFAEKFPEICAASKEGVKSPTTDDLEKSQAILVKATNDLLRAVASERNRAAATAWRQSLQLDALKETLANADGPDDAVLRAVLAAFDADSRATRPASFNTIRTELRNYRALVKLVNIDGFEERYAKVVDNLPQYVDEYAKTSSPEYALALTEALVWLEDASVAVPKARVVAELVRNRLGHSNAVVKASADFVGVAFKRELSETIEINDMISGTRVVGTGVLEGQSTAVFVPNSKAAEIKVLVSGTMESETTGKQKMVTLKMSNSGSMTGEKSILISAEKITTGPTSAKANLKAKILSQKIDAGPLVRGIAQDEINSRRPQSEAEAKRLAEARMKSRIDAQVNPRIAELESRFQKQLREPLIEAGLFPSVWNFSTTESFLETDARLAAGWQPAAPEPAAAYDKKADLLVKIHQSSLNNMTQQTLSAKFFDEEKVVENLKKRFENFPVDVLSRGSDQKPIQVTFAEKMPVFVTFIENKIKVVFRIDKFVQEGTEYPGLDITVLLNVKMETSKGENGEDVTVIALEQAEAPAVYPRGFVAGRDKVSARHQAIRTIVTKRLDSSLEKRYALEPIELKQEWEGGRLVPSFVSAENGWLTLAWVFVR